VIDTRQSKGLSAISNEDRIQVRFYEKRDLEIVASLFTDSVRALTGSRYNLEQRQVWAPQPADLKEWRSRLRTLQTLLAEVDSRCVGFLSYQPHGYIDLLYVRPGSERTGVATRLYQSVERILVHSGVDTAFTEASLIAQPFFKGQGFQTTRFEEICVGGVLLPRWVMYKALPHPPSGYQSEST
jgi:putative acetyltransferase